MSQATLSRENVSVLEEPYGFIVAVGAIPVLRCTVRRDAMRYAVLIRKALRRPSDDSEPESDHDDHGLE